MYIYYKNDDQIMCLLIIININVIVQKSNYGVSKINFVKASFNSSLGNIGFKIIIIFRDIEVIIKDSIQIIQMSRSQQNL
uniref:Uncharacterized protein n=1 Tax=Lepeophtheirus salmonis TaxID=72036 RepID=A0A0K2UK48_LEPSM